MGTETRYLMIQWPEYQMFLGRPDIYYCVETDSYFIPEDVYLNNEYSEDCIESFNNLD